MRRRLGRRLLTRKLLSKCLSYRRRVRARVSAVGLSSLRSPRWVRRQLCKRSVNLACCVLPVS